MILYMVRHGEAGGRLLGAVAKFDAARELTKEGRKTSARVAKTLRVLGCLPDRVVSSPLPRAFRTAEILAGILEAGGVEKCAALSPGRAPAEFFGWLAGADEEALLIVGHMPHLGLLAGAALGGARACVDFKKSGAACVSFEGVPKPGGGRLEWLLQPGQLKALRRAWKK